MKQFKNAIRNSELPMEVQTSALKDIQDMQKNKGYRDRVGYQGNLSDLEVLGEAFNFSASKLGKEFWQGVALAV